MAGPPASTNVLERRGRAPDDAPVLVEHDVAETDVCFVAHGSRGMADAERAGSGRKMTSAEIFNVILPPSTNEQTLSSTVKRTAPPTFPLASLHPEA